MQLTLTSTVAGYTATIVCEHDDLDAALDALSDATTRLNAMTPVQPTPAPKHALNDRGRAMLDFLTANPGITAWQLDQQIPKSIPTCRWLMKHGWIEFDSKTQKYTVLRTE
jgi:hypothetical protein